MIRTAQHTQQSIILGHLDIFYTLLSKQQGSQGRQFPVEVLYTESPQDSYLDAALTAVLQLHTEQLPGDILVFLTGQEEIDSLEQLLKTRHVGIHPFRIRGLESGSPSPD